MEEQIYRIVRIDEEDFGCEGRPEGDVPMVSVTLEAASGETKLVYAEDSLMYTRKLDVGGFAVIGADGMLYAPEQMRMDEEMTEHAIDFDKQAAWMEQYWEALEELDE